MASTRTRATTHTHTYAALPAPRIYMAGTDDPIYVEFSGTRLVVDNEHRMDCMTRRIVATMVAHAINFNQVIFTLGSMPDVDGLVQQVQVFAQTDINDLVRQLMPTYRGGMDLGDWQYEGWLQMQSNPATS